MESKSLRWMVFVLTAALIMGLSACGGSSAENNNKPVAESQGNSAQEIEEETQDLQTETEEPSIPVEVQIANAYLQILRRDEIRIRAYNWQNEGYNGSDNTPVAIKDVTGDQIPDLVYMTTSKDVNKAWYTGDLHIYTFEADTGNAVELYYGESWDIHVAGATRYCLFLRKDGSFCGYNSYGDYLWTNIYGLFSMEEDGRMEFSTLLKRFTYAKEDSSERFNDYTGLDGVELAEEEYRKQKTELIDSFAVCLLQKNIDDNELEIAADKAESIAMTYDEAVEYLQGLAGESESKIAEAKEIFDVLDDLQFCFSSGAGFWATFLLINEDGTFIGNYHDTDMGGRSDSYPNGTRYICDFEGQFSALEKTSNYIYRLKLEKLSYDREPGETWIEDGVLMIASEAYGLEDSIGEELILYLPGTPLSALSERLQNRFSSSSVNERQSEKLSGYILYNEKKDHLFGGSSYGVNEEGILPESSKRLLTESDIVGMSEDDIQLAINTIYARHGYQFKDSELLAYFKGFEWYYPTETDMEKVKNSFREVERKNIDFLASKLK